MWMPLIVGAALLFKKQDEPAPPPAAPPVAPPPTADVTPDVKYYLTTQSLLRAQDLMATQGMSADEAAQQAASDVVDDYAKKTSNGNGKSADYQYDAAPRPGRPQSLAPIDHAEETW
jgi:hypothetical protein